MKIFSILKLASVLNPHPQEDYFIVSKKYPIFVVADGVSLNSDSVKDYPKDSGAGQVAKIFCEAVISTAEKKYENFKTEDLKKIFEAGNKSALEYNISQGRTKETINYYDIDLFSATTSFALIKGKKVYWWSLCDSGMMVFENGKKIFKSPGGWINFPQNWNEEKGDKEKIIIRHRDYRNVVNKKGEPIGYGAVTGEETAKPYLNTGALDVNAGDLIFLFTDGFENYFDLKEFTNLFQSWPENIESQLETIISEKSKAEPEKYGSEKTLTAISV